METYAFWREREARFKELSTRDGAFDLHALRSEEVDLPALLRESSERTRAAIANPLATPESVYGHVLSVARAGRILLDGEQADKWHVSGGPGSELARVALQMTFKAEAMIAAAGAGEADAAATDQAALEAWLDFLWTRLPHHRFANFGVEHLAHASTEMCEQLASRAYREEPANQRQSLIALPSNAMQAPTRAPSTADRRTSVIEPILTSRGLSKSKWADKAGVDPSVVYDYMAGKSNPRPENRKALAEVIALSELPE